MLNNLHDYGANSFSQYLITSKKDISVKQEAISLICSQYLGFKKFAETLNLFLKQLLKVSTSRSLKDLCMNINIFFKDVLQYEEVKLWIVNEMTGVLTSYDESGKMLKIMSSKGLLGESLKLCEAAYKKKEKDKYLYRML